MVLVIDGLIQEEHPPDSRTMFLRYPSFKEINNQFLSIQPKVIGSTCLLYVQQREMAVTMSYDSKYLLRIYVRERENHHFIYLSCKIKFSALINEMEKYECKIPVYNNNVLIRKIYHL